MTGFPLLPGDVRIVGREDDARDWFDGCHNVPLFDLGGHEALVGPLSVEPDRSLCTVVERVCQLSLPAELLPVPSGRLFA